MRYQDAVHLTENATWRQVATCVKLITSSESCTCTGDHTDLLRAVWRMEPDDSPETASSWFSKQDETKQDETLGLSSVAGKHSSISNVKLSQITSSMEPSVQLPVGSLESMDRELGQRRTDFKFLQELPECLHLHSDTYLTITEFCLWHVSASETGPPSLITKDADELISYLNGIFLIETLQWTSRREKVSHEERHRIEAAAGTREHCWNALLYAIEKCQSLRKLQMFGPELKIEEVHLLCQSLLRSQVEDLTLRFHEDESVFQGFWVSEGALAICKMMAMNHNLKHLSFNGMVVTARTCRYFGSMLSTNSTLESLCIGGREFHSFAAKVLLEPLTGDGENLPLNTTLKRLAISGYATEAIVDMLATNNSLTHLTLHTMLSTDLPSSDVCMIVQSLKTNKSFQKLTITKHDWTLPDHDPWGTHDLEIDDLEIDDPWGVQGRDNVFAQIMDLLQVNPWLKDIDIRALDKAQRETIKAQLATNLEIVEKMDDIKTSQQIPIEGEVSQRMQDWTLPDHDPWDIQELEIDEPWGVQGRHNVSAGIMDLLQVNPWLKDTDSRALDKAQREAIKAQLATNLEIVEKMDDIKTSQQIPIEGEVSQRMQEFNLFTNLEASVANLKVSMYKAKPMSSF